jgi:4-hydroxyproline epimerase
LRIVDSHTEGEPTRVVVSGGPDLGDGSVADQLERLRRQHDDLRRALISEPRGNPALVGALLCPPADPACAAGVIFFNNAGYLGMCGHGSIGVAVTLGWLGRDLVGAQRLETPVGDVRVTLHDRNTVTVENVPSYVHAQDVAVSVSGLPPITGDVAWGGNWFFIADWPHTPLAPGCVPELLDIAGRLKGALAAAGITGRDGAEIDHIELTTTVRDGQADSRNFVLCPGNEWDRSPCGTGTSAKLACLAARGELAPGETWTQDSVSGGRFTAHYRPGADGAVVASITGRAWITADAQVVRQAGDPFRDGMPGR